eukprot:CAMPEP_0206015700 /NCGR_PEP_ID=MMETSP1464-20131121/20899_1 /ASSEMBLY_ACC=CAM_ASM_001124 /TAXON_ID=119497 /ORGANISM="Exanthemachrysis gayraliae, Strain RCC1523" /LENGTH=41 /DNA_ID= /DNA_START= /DNA_END= /DNA_ORIENTATION=
MAAWHASKAPDVPGGALSEGRGRARGVWLAAGPGAGAGKAG